MNHLPTSVPKLGRREVLRLGALTIAGYQLLPFAKPQNVSAASQVRPRASADRVIFLNLSGGPSQMDTFDVKLAKWGPENRDVRQTKYGYQYPYGLMPKLVNHLDKLAVVRSMEAWETVHSRGQYYLQTGHAVSPARIKEMPSIGAVVAYESLKRRKDTDFLPPFISMNYEPNVMTGPLWREGCLPADCSPLTLDLKDNRLPFTLEEKDRAAFHRRWDLLNRIDTSRRDLDAHSGQAMRQFDSFGKAVERMMTNPAIGKVTTLQPEERKTYGSTPLGDACLVARNMVAADAGAKFLLVTQNGWDHHRNIYGQNAKDPDAPDAADSVEEAPGKAKKKSGPDGVYGRCQELDAALSSLLADLSRMKSSSGETLLDRTLVLCMGEFGRAPGELTSVGGREHYDKAMFALFAGAGVIGGRALGATDNDAAKVIEFGWRRKRPIYIEDVGVTIYSALGIDWSKRIQNTPSGRDFVYIDPAAGQGVFDFQEISDLYA